VCGREADGEVKVGKVENRYRLGWTTLPSWLAISSHLVATLLGWLLFLVLRIYVFAG